MSGTTIGYDSPLSVALRGGGDVLIWPDRVTSGAEIYPLAELTRVAVVSAPVTADIAAPAAGLVPALLLQLRDGRAPLFVPSEPPDASRILAAILRLRPELDVESKAPRSASHPPQLEAQPPLPQGNASADMRPRKAPPESIAPIAPTDRALAGLAHLSVFYMPLLLPLLLWLGLRAGSPYASRQAKQAFFFHLLILAVVSVVLIPVWVVLFVSGLTLATASNSSGVHSGGATLSISSLVCGGTLMIVLAIALTIYGVYGAVQAFMGKPFHYPLLQRL